MSYHSHSPTIPELVAETCIERRSHKKRSVANRSLTTKLQNRRLATIPHDCAELRDADCCVHKPSAFCRESPSRPLSALTEEPPIVPLISTKIHKTCPPKGDIGLSSPTPKTFSWCPHRPQLLTPVRRHRWSPARARLQHRSHYLRGHRLSLQGHQNCAQKACFYSYPAPVSTLAQLIWNHCLL